VSSLSDGSQVRPIRKRRRQFNEDKRQAIKDETQKLLAAGHIREIQYPEWLANVVLVKKSSGKWRMCVDFTDLNKACPKDSYPLPSIDALVDSASRCKLLSFLDAFSGYNQIKMHPMDEEKTAFMTERSCYCYKVMPFGLKNEGATYQRLMDKVLAPMLRRNVQAYVDDMVVTSLENIPSEAHQPLQQLGRLKREHPQRTGTAWRRWGVLDEVWGGALNCWGLDHNPPLLLAD